MPWILIGCWEVTIYNKFLRPIYTLKKYTYESLLDCDMDGLLDSLSDDEKDGLKKKHSSNNVRL